MFWRKRRRFGLFGYGFSFLVVLMAYHLIMWNHYDNFSWNTNLNNFQGNFSQISQNVKSQFNSIWNNPTALSVNQKSKYIQYAFTRESSGERPDQLLVSTINKAKKTLDIAIYSITRYDIVDAILNAKKRGVDVKVITDRQASLTDLYQRRALTELKGAGIPILENTHQGLMHLKLTVVDNEYVALGSFNYSTEASTVNDEVLMVIDNSQFANDCTAEFNKMWNDHVNYAPWK